MLIPLLVYSMDGGRLRCSHSKSGNRARARGIKVSASIVRLLRRTSRGTLHSPAKPSGTFYFHALLLRPLELLGTSASFPLSLSLSLSVFLSFALLFFPPAFLYGIIHGKAVWFLQEFSLFRVREARAKIIDSTVEAMEWKEHSRWKKSKHLYRLRAGVIS